MKKKVEDFLFYDVIAKDISIRLLKTASTAIQQITMMVRRRLPKKTVNKLAKIEKEINHLVLELGK